MVRYLTHHKFALDAGSLQSNQEVEIQFESLRVDPGVSNTCFTKINAKNFSAKLVFIKPVGEDSVTAAKVQDPRRFLE